MVLTDTVSADTLIASIRKAEKIIITRKDPPGKKAPSDPLVSEISMSGAVAACSGSTSSKNGSTP